MTKALWAETRSIVQTSDGYLLLGTEFGLVRFDGVRFTPWLPPVGRRLASSNITALFVTRDGALWIGTTEGLASFRDGRLTDYPRSTEGPSLPFWRTTRERCGLDSMADFARFGVAIWSAPRLTTNCVVWP